VSGGAPQEGGPAGARTVENHFTWFFGFKWLFLSLFDLFTLFWTESQKSQFLAIFGHFWLVLKCKMPIFGCIILV